MESPWIAFREANEGARVRLICLPYAGGGASVFRSWVDALLPSIDVCPVQLPGRESRFREPLISRLEELVTELVVALRPLLRSPYALFGHSVGALVAYELAVALERTDCAPPVRIFASGRRAPQLGTDTPPIHTLPRDAFIARLRQLNGTPQAVLDNDELMDLVQPILSADLAVSETYCHGSPRRLSCAITAIGGTRDKEATREQLEAWQAVTDAPVTVQMLDGDHFFIDSRREEVIAIVRAALIMDASDVTATGIVQ